MYIWTQIADKNCVNSTLVSESDKRDRASIYVDESCRVTGFWPYLFMIAYLVLLKLIMITLLFALFSMSAVVLTQDTDTIWKFQRYGLVQDFVTRNPLPPPLNVFSYIYLFFRWIYNFRRFTQSEEVRLYSSFRLILIQYSIIFFRKM